MTKDEAIEILKYHKCPDSNGIDCGKYSGQECHEAMDIAIAALNAQKWIPCSERLPKCEKEVFILTEKGQKTTAIYEDGKMVDENSMWAWSDIDFNYDEEKDENLIPEGWWEYRHFNPDEVYNNKVDEEVVAWMSLPEPYREEQN